MSRLCSKIKLSCRKSGMEALKCLLPPDICFKPLSSDSKQANKVANCRGSLGSMFSLSSICLCLYSAADFFARVIAEEEADFGEEALDDPMFVGDPMDV